MYIFKNTVTYLLLIALFAFDSQQCNLINPAEVKPTYVRIDSFKMGNVPLNFSRSHDISNVWVYWNGALIGTYDLPATIPIMAKEAGKLRLVAGISVGGLNNFLGVYPFYKSDTSTLEPQPGKTITYIPTTSYVFGALVKTISDFELGSSSTNFGLASGTVPIAVTNKDSLVFNGNGSGAIVLRVPSDTLSEDSSKIDLPITINKDAYIEFNYRNTVPFAVGLKSSMSGYSYSRYLYGAYPTSTWKKFYFPIKDFAAQYKGDRYTLYIKASLPEGDSTGTVYFDDIKLVYFN